MGVINNPMNNTIVLGVSDRLRDLTLSAATDIQAEAPRTMPVASPISRPAGRAMTKAPINPTTVAPQRLILTVSLRNSAAPIVANKGVVKLSAVASATGIIETPMNHRSIADRPITERKPCSGSRVVFNAPIPVRRNQGNINSKPKRFLKKASSTGCISLDMFLTTVVSAAKLKAVNTIHNAPRRGPGRPSFVEGLDNLFSAFFDIGGTLCCTGTPYQPRLHIPVLRGTP